MEKELDEIASSFIENYSSCLTSDEILDLYEDMTPEDAWKEEQSYWTND